MNDNFLHPLPLSEAKQRILSIEENKIKNLELRLTGPSSEGKMPAECEPLKEADLENLKSKFFGDNSLYQCQIQNNNLSNQSLKESSNMSASSGTKKKSSLKSKKSYIDNISCSSIYFLA